MMSSKLLEKISLKDVKRPHSGETGAATGGAGEQLDLIN